MPHPKKYKNKYRRGSIRAGWWDYNGNGIYHIEINLKPRICYLGRIQNQKPVLSEAGKIVEKEWLAIPTNFPYATLDEYVVMPDHFHGIIHISVPPQQPRDSSRDSQQPRDSSRGLSQTPAPSSNTPPSKGGATGSKNPMLHDGLGRCIRYFKAMCTIQIRKSIPEFKWQAKFWDNIIGSQKELEGIRKYIRDNPKKWISP